MDACLAPPRLRLRCGFGWFGVVDVVWESLLNDLIREDTESETRLPITGECKWAKDPWPCPPDFIGVEWALNALAWMLEMADEVVPGCTLL